MKEGQDGQTLRVRLLALALALALIWYAMNPAPGPVRQVQRDEGQPDEQRREARRPARVSDGLELIAASVLGSATDPLSSSAEISIDDLEWPEVIDLW